MRKMSAFKAICSDSYSSAISLIYFYDQQSLRLFNRSDSPAEMKWIEVNCGEDGSRGQTQATVSQDLCMGLLWQVLPVSVWMFEVIPCMTDETGWIFLFPVFDDFLQNGWEWKPNHLLHTLSPPSPVNQPAWMDTDGAHITLLHSCCQSPACSQPLCHNEKAVCLYFELSRCMWCWRGGVGRGGLAAWWVEQREPVECFRCMGSETKADTEQHGFVFF